MEVNALTCFHFTGLEDRAFNAVIPQKEQGLLGELVVLEVLAVGCLLHSNNTVAFTLLHLQEVSELRRLHLMDRL